MSRQTSLSNYFKMKSNVSLTNESVNKNSSKRSSTAIIKTPTPTKTKRNTIANSEDVVNLCSDDEFPSNVFTNSETESPCKIMPLTPSDTSDLVDEKNENSPKTPQKKSTPIKKYFSPTKKRKVLKNSPVKKNLTQELFEDSETAKDLNFSTKMEDDKTKLLLTNIQNLVNEPSLFKLLDEVSQNVLNKCLILDQNALRLVCRLYWRRYIWYTFEALEKICKDNENNYVDTPMVHIALNTLVENGLLLKTSTEGGDDIDFDELTKLLKVNKLMEVCKYFKLAAKSKEKAIQLLKSYCQRKPITLFITGNHETNEERVMKMLREKFGECYKLSFCVITALYKLHLITYLGIKYDIIRKKKLEWTVILDMIKKETFPIEKTMVLDNASCVFESRDEFESYLEAHMTYEKYLTQTDLTKKCEIVREVYKTFKVIMKDFKARYAKLPEWLQKYSPPYVYMKILEDGIQELKRQKTVDNYLLSVKILTSLIKQKVLRHHRMGAWYSEKALLLHKYLRRHEEAAKLLINAFKSNTSDEIKESMQSRALRLSSQFNVNIDNTLRETLRSYALKGCKLENNLPQKYIQKIPKDNYGIRAKIKFEVWTHGEKQIMSVEEYCNFYYTTIEDYTHARHWEGKIVTTLFHLLFWDIIYGKVDGKPGLFLTYYQVYPLDMHGSSFYINRKELIDERLIEISNYTEEELLEDIENKWTERPDYELSGIVRSIGLENIKMVSSCLGPRKVAIICERLATNYGYTQSGFPDVTAWNYNTRKITFLEVKSDCDKPSIKQLQWMHYLHDNGIDTSFVYIGAQPHRIHLESRIEQVYEGCSEDDN